MKTFLPLLILGAACASVSAAIPLIDTFTYPDGSLTNVSNIKWRNTGGVLNQVNVSAGRVELTSAETEDVDALLSGGPFTAAGSTLLYARFTVNFSALPTGSQGDYFAHYGSSANKCRVFATTNGAAGGKFRIGISAGSNAATNKFPSDLSLGQTYTVVTRYTVSNAACVLWINPAAESDVSVAAADIPSASTIATFNWRQSPDIGTLFVDDLVVGTSFNEALTGDATPAISDIADRAVAEGSSTPTIPFTVSDLETPATSLTVFAQTSDSNLVQSIALAGVGTNRSITVTTPAGQTGTTTITVFVTDGSTTNSDSFVLTVIPALLLAEDFNYPDGPLVGNSTWTHHSGTTTGQVQIASGKAVLSTAFTEDVNVPLPGGPFATNSGVQLYASLRVNFSQLPNSAGDYVAHFNNSSGRCRLFVGTNNAGAGKFRVGIGNGTNAVSEQLATDLATNTTHRLVLRYNLATGISTVWANPAAETDPGTNATDVAAATALSTFAFREDPGIGTFTVDDLRLGLTFAAVTAAAGPPLRLERLAAGRARLAWPATATGFSLQSNTNLATTNWQDVVATPVVTGAENVVTNIPASNPAFYRLKK